MSDSSDLLNGLLPFPVSFTTLALILVAIIAGSAATMKYQFYLMMREDD